MTTPKKDGDCFVAAIRTAIDLAPLDVHVCHGYVTRTDRSGNVVCPRHVHAWVEVERPLPAPFEPMTLTFCLDRSNGGDHELPRDLYYRIGHVEDVTCYTRREALHLLIEHEHYGPWTNGERE